MTGIAEDVATHCAESCADKAMQELKYLCCYKSYVDDFQDEQKCLSAKRDTVLQDIKEAKDRNEDQIENEVKLWLDRANDLIQEDTKGKKKWFGLIPNCFWQYKRGKDWEGKARRIKGLIEKSNDFPRVARFTGLPGIEFYSSANFMQFEDRKLHYKKLQAALKDDKFMIGLHGLGGTGKTTMAIQVGIEVADSKVFDKVIFTVVSKDPNLKKIRDNIAKHLNLTFNEGMDESEQLWKKIAEGEKKVLIVLDDAWEKLTLREIGIPLGHHGKGCCAILLTTRSWKVCGDMGCDETIALEVLNEKDAVDLVLSYADQRIDDSFNDFKDVALGIVKECGRLPVAIVPVASALKYRPLIEWKQGLDRLQNSKAIHYVNEDLKEAYNSLRLSYDYLKNEEARKLFLLCSLFPENYEIPIELLTRIARCLGLCGEATRYSITRSHFTPIKNVLMDSCLLLKAENEAVKMQNLVREVALWIGNKLVQVAMDSSTTLMENIQYSSWNIIDFPYHFDGRKLEVLLLWISNNADSTTVKVPDGIFEGMENLKFLSLMNWSNIRISCASLFQSHPSLINVRTLAIKGFELGDISILANLKRLESLELSKCSMIELPNEIRELDKLRLLEIVECEIERNNPFAVIGSCLQLEELYFVLNRMDEDSCKSPPQITTFPEFERYQIKAWRGFCNYKVDFSISGYFDSNEHFKVNFSNETFKSLVERAKVLKLDGDYYNRGWTNVVPDILPMKDDSKEDHLTRLCLQSMKGIEHLIHTERLPSGVAIFSKLLKLKLCDIAVKELCRSPYPVSFLKQLEKLHLSWCKNLEGPLFDGKLELCNLKSINLNECSMTCLFHPFIAQSLKKLEMLHIEKCSELKCIVAEPKEDHDPNQKSHDSIFPKLKYLEVESGPELEFILPICFCKDLPLLESMEVGYCEKLKYIFGQYPKERDLHQMGTEAILQSLEEVVISKLPNFINIYTECYLPSDEVRKSSQSTKVEDGSSSLSRSPLCWFWPKSNASTIYHPSPSMNHNQASMVKYVVNRAHGLFTLPLYQYTRLRRLKIYDLVRLKSLFTLSIVSSLKLLEILEVRSCDTLEHIVIDKEDGHDHMNVNSIFPNLRMVYVSSCSHLKYIFPAFYSNDLKDLESVWIKRQEELSSRKAFPLQEKVEPPYNLQESPEFKGPKSYTSFQNLSQLRIQGCKQLKFILSASTARMLQKLQQLDVSECEELVSIIEEDGESKKNPMAPHQVYFPELRVIEVRDCKSMKFLFSIASGKLPRLWYVDIEETPQLGEVFRWKHGEGQELVMEDVFPRLHIIRLVNLPALHTICQGIDFHTVKLRRVRNCPAISLTSANDSYEELIKLSKSFGRDSVCEYEDVNYVRWIISIWAEEIEVEGSQDVGNGSTMLQQNNGSPNFAESEEVSTEIVVEDLTTYSNLPNLTKEVRTECDGNFYKPLGQDCADKLAKVDENLEATFGEGPSLEKYDKASSSTYSKPKIEKPHALSPSKDDLVHKASSSTPSKLTITSQGTSASTKDPSISTPKKSQVATSTAPAEPKSSQSDLLDISIATECPQTAKERSMAISECYAEHKENRISPNLSEIEVEGSQQDIGNYSTMLQQNNGLPNFVKSTTASANGIVEEKLSTTPSYDLDMEVRAECDGNFYKPLGQNCADKLAKVDQDNLVHKASSSTHSELTISNQGTSSSIEVEIMTNDETSTNEEEMKFDQKSSSQIFEEHDLMRLFQMMKEGDDMEVHLSYVSKLIADLHDNKEVSNALADLETSLKKGLNEIACSEERRLCLQNALNILSSHCSEDGAPSHGLQATIHSLQQEIQTIFSSFSQAYTTIDTFTKLEQKEKLMIEQCSKREKDAKTLIYDTNNTKNSIIEAQLNEAELKEQISKLQADLWSKEKEIEEYERKLLSLQEQEKKSVSDTIEFTLEFLAMERKKSRMVEDQMKARQQLENMEAKWPSCLYNLKKTMMLLGVHLKQKL